MSPGLCILPARRPVRLTTSDNKDIKSNGFGVKLLVTT